MSEVLNRFDVWDEAQPPDPHPLYAEMRRERYTSRLLSGPYLAK